ncbi:metal-dependent hydrolase [Natronomonas sp.]|uniref:metal-dependent hydrolase n=1 Tax=Natronomonas sp. TaxID=2184060 RepID=UPI0026168A01|nr:metal-dependent hydrolase [Natronomonas sp.]
MPSSVVHAALALVLGVGLLGRFYDRRALVVLLAVVVAPEVDTVFGLAFDGAHRTVLHNMVYGTVLAGVLYWETGREESLIRGRWGARGVRIAWVGLFVHTFAHLALDWGHLEGINLLWPLYDRFFTLEGELFLSTSEGLVQTFVEITADPDTGTTVVDAGQGGTRAETHVDNPAQPSDEPDPGPVDRRFPIAVRGWQLYLVVTALGTLLAKRLQTPRRSR